MRIIRLFFRYSSQFSWRENRGDEVEEEEDVGSSLVPEEWEADSGIPRCGHHHHHPLTLTFQRSPRFWR